MLARAITAKVPKVTAAGSISPRGASVHPAFSATLHATAKWNSAIPGSSGPIYQRGTARSALYCAAAVSLSGLVLGEPAMSGSASISSSGTLFDPRTARAT